MIDLSIILPTCNRAGLLARAIETIAASTRCRWELIVVDGASNDGTWDTLLHFQNQLGDRMQVIREEKRQGFVKAMNRGFLSARGRYMTWLNDDARPVGGGLDDALAQIDRAPEDVAFVAMFHRWHSPRNVAYQLTAGRSIFSLCHVRGTLYANFPMGRRDMFDRLGYFDERFVFCAADPDLSLKAWHAGYRIEPAWGACIDHDQHEDDRRTQDQSNLRADNERLFAKWELPGRNTYFNDFDPAHPCTLRGMRESAAIAA
jgi:GT2 family glycosyltransferase